MTELHRADEFFEAMQAWVETIGRPCFINRAVGVPGFPYTVLDPEWESTSELAQEMLGDPGANRFAVFAMCYGRANQDALWMDEQVYATLVDQPTWTGSPVEILHVTAQASPVLTFMEVGVMLAKRRYVVVFR